MSLWPRRRQEPLLPGEPAPDPPRSYASVYAARIAPDPVTGFPTYYPAGSGDDDDDEGSGGFVRAPYGLIDLVLALQERGHKVWQGPQLPDGVFNAGELFYDESLDRLWVSLGDRWLRAHDPRGSDGPYGWPGAGS